MSNHTGEALKHPTVAQKYGAPPEAIRFTKHPPSVMVCKHQYLMSCWSPILCACACDAGWGVRASTLWGGCSGSPPPWTGRGFWWRSSFCFTREERQRKKQRWNHDESHSVINLLYMYAYTKIYVLVILKVWRGKNLVSTLYFSPSHFFRDQHSLFPCILHAVCYTIYVCSFSIYIHALQLRALTGSLRIQHGLCMHAHRM